MGYEIIMYKRWIQELESYGCIVRRGYLDFESDERYATWVVNVQCGGSRYFGSANNPLSRMLQPIRLYRYVRRMRRYFKETSS